MVEIKITLTCALLATFAHALIDGQPQRASHGYATSVIRLVPLQGDKIWFSLGLASWIDIIGIVVSIVGLAGVSSLAWIFSRGARARSKLNRMGVAVTGEALVTRIKEGDVLTSKLLLLAGVRPDQPVGATTPLRAAINAKSAPLLRLLLAHDRLGAIMNEILAASPEDQSAARVEDVATVSRQRVTSSDRFGTESQFSRLELPGVQEMMDHLQRILATDLNFNSGDVTELLNFGLDLEVVQTFLLYRLVFQKGFHDLKYKGMLIDSRAPLIRPMIDGGSSIHSGTAGAVVEKMNNQLAEKAALLVRRNISVEIRSYSMPPVIHGFLIGDSHLYLGFTEFDNDKLQGGQFPYLYFRREKSDELSEHLFRMFRTWFTYNWNNSTQVCPSTKD